MASVIFIHGIGVRAAAYWKTFAHIEATLQSRNANLRLAPCLWGETLGARLHVDGASIPNYTTTRSLDEIDAEDEERVLWDLLYRDPLFELRLFALSTFPASLPQPELVLNSKTAGEELHETIRSFSIDSELEGKLSVLGIAATDFHEARLAVISSSPYQAALRRSDNAQGELRTIIARAFVAQAIALCAWEKGSSDDLWNASARDEVVELLIAALGDTDRSIGGAMAKFLLFPVFTQYLRYRRGKVTDVASPRAGDVVLYQARGGAIREYIWHQIELASPPIVLLAHSLGGVACVDLLVQQPSLRRQIDLLVTVGSQAPYLYEIGALSSLVPPQPLPQDFPTWLNIYDENDFLSYVGEKIFPQFPRIYDVPVDNRQPFPQAHSAYWSNPATWDAIEGYLP